MHISAFNTLRNAKHARLEGKTKLFTSSSAVVVPNSLLPALWHDWSPKNLIHSCYCRCDRRAVKLKEFAVDKKNALRLNEPELTGTLCIRFSKLPAINGFGSNFYRCFSIQFPYHRLDGCRMLGVMKLKLFFV